MILGGERSDTVPVADLYKTAFDLDILIQQTDARTAMLTKHMENCFRAPKVTSCNEFCDPAETFAVESNELRDLLLVDPRIGRSQYAVGSTNRQLRTRGTRTAADSSSSTE